MDNKTKNYLLTGLSIIVVVGGIYIYRNNNIEDKKNASINTQTQIIQQSEVSEYISEEEAKLVALNHMNGDIDSIELLQCEFEIDDRIPEYEIKFISDNIKYEYTVNGTTGTIINYENESLIKEEVINQNNIVDTQAEYIGEEKAKEIAISHANVTDVTFLTCKFEYDDGIAEYEVEWYVGNMEYDYTINAITGNIIDFDVEYER